MRRNLCFPVSMLPPNTRRALLLMMIGDEERSPSSVLFDVPVVDGQPGICWRRRERVTIRGAHLRARGMEMDDGNLNRI
ncbi:MAG: hypothetical protein P8124_09980 [Gammaproteobacteria bacterium]